jgi:hypothetical protein
MAPSPGEPVKKALMSETEKERWKDVTASDFKVTITRIFEKLPVEPMAQNSLTLVDGEAARGAATLTGAEEKRSYAVHDKRTCPECLQDEGDLWIGVNERFSGSGTESVPHHAACRCGVDYRWPTR